MFLASRCKIHEVVRGFCPHRYTKTTTKEMDKSFVNIVRESLIKPTPGTSFLFIKYQQGFSSTRSYLIKNPSSKYNKPKKDLSLFSLKIYMQSACRSLTRTKQNMHKRTNLVTAVLFVIITKKRSTSFDHKTKGARSIDNENFFLIKITPESLHLVTK